METLLITKSDEAIEKTVYQFSPETVTLLLAYVHYYTPKWHPIGRSIDPAHLRKISCVIGQTSSKIWSLKDDRLLAGHFALLHCANFLSLAPNGLLVLPKAMEWLHCGTREMQLKWLIKDIDDDAKWAHSISQLRLGDCLGIDYQTFMSQQLKRQYEQCHRSDFTPARWVEIEDGQAWHLDLPDNLPLWLRFDLLQLGNWSPEEPFVCTPITIATASRRGYGEQTIQWLLETATGTSLSSKQVEQLHLWVNNANAYRVQTVHLLSTAQDQQLRQILRLKRLRQFVVAQISPRHAVVQPAIEAPLARWLKKQSFSLDGQLNQDDATPSSLDHGIYHWLGLRLLIGLGSLINLPYPPPHQLLEDATNQLPSVQVAELEQIAERLVNNLRDAIRGKDTFFPTERPINEAYVDKIRDAIAHEKQLVIMYRALGDRQSRTRKIQPLRLELRGHLGYLHAYCYLAERNLTFRVDRIEAVSC